MNARDPEKLTDDALLGELIRHGGVLVRACQERQAEAGRVYDDPRWVSSPVPLRFEAQLHGLFFSAIDAFDVAASLLASRASQQVFGIIRFQAETLALIRWMAEPTDGWERQGRAYRVVFAQIGRWLKVLSRDTQRDDAVDTLVRARAAMRKLADLAQVDGYEELLNPPDRPWLFETYLREGGYGAFGMYSELGSHPGAVGNILFAIGDDVPGPIAFKLSGAFGLRAFWTGAALMFFCHIVREVAVALEWNDWLLAVLTPILDEAAPNMLEAARRKGKSASGGPA